MKQELRNKGEGNFFIRYIKSFFHALNGIGYAFRYEHNMYIIFLAMIIVTGAGFSFQISQIEWLFCIIAMGLVTAVELINSAIEAVCDRVTLKSDPLIKIAKDTASGASLVLSITAALIGILIFFPKVMELFS